VNTMYLPVFAAAVESWLSDHNVLHHCATHHPVVDGQIAMLDLARSKTVAHVVVVDSKATAMEIRECKKFYPKPLWAEVSLDGEHTPAQAGLLLLRQQMTSFNLLLHESALLTNVDRINKFTISNLLGLFDMHPSADTMVMGKDLVGDLWADVDAFAPYFSPVEKHARLETGLLGTFCTPEPAGADHRWKENTREVDLFSDTWFDEPLFPSRYVCLYSKAATHFYTYAEPLRSGGGGSLQIYLSSAFSLVVEGEANTAVWFPPLR
jgi:hypothetical protein